MKYISIDIETSGLTPSNCEILSIGAIIEDTTNPLSFNESSKFYAIIIHEMISGSPTALSMNSEILKLSSEWQNAGEISKKKALIEKASIVYGENVKNLHVGFFRKEDVVIEFFKWLCKNDFYQGYIDDRGGSYQSKIPSIDGSVMPIKINVAGKNFGTFDKVFLEQLPRWKQLISIRQRILDPAVLFVDWKEDEAIPSLTECKKRVGLKNAEVSHMALEDAWDVISLFRKFYF
jgi:hypothetical protein